MTEYCSASEGGSSATATKFGMTGVWYGIVESRPKLSRRYISFTGVDRTPHWHGIRIEGMHPASALLFTSAKVGAGYVCTLSVCLSVHRIITQNVVAKC